MNLLWPVHRNSMPGAIARFGRILHWVSILVAALWTLGCMWGFGTGSQNVGVGDIVLVFAMAAVIYVAGRGARYVLSGE